MKSVVDLQCAIAGSLEKSRAPSSTITSPPISVVPSNKTTTTTSQTEKTQTSSSLATSKDEIEKMEVDEKVSCLHCCFCLNQPAKLQKKQTVEECMFHYIALYIECRFNKITLLRSCFFRIFRWLEITSVSKIFANLV